MSLIEIKRNLRSASIISGFIAFAIGLLITQGKVSIPFFNFAYFLPKKIEGVGAWLYEDTIKGFKEIIDGKHDELPEQAFYMVGTIEEAVEQAKKLMGD